MMRFKLLPAVALLLLSAGVGCVLAQPRTSNINLGAIFDTGKNLIKSQTVGSMSTEEEVAVGKDIANSVFVTYPVVQNPAFQVYLNQVGVWIAQQSARAELPWRFALVASNNINAFAVPGGTVLVTQGMVAHLRNEAELACVLGHEIAHIVRRHHIAVLQKSLLLEAGASALNAQSGPETVLSGRQQLLSEGKELFTRGLDRSAEREADDDGLLLMARAGYDPQACLDFMQGLAALKANVGSLESLYKTHPPAKERAQDIAAALARLQGAAPGAGARPAMPSP